MVFFPACDITVIFGGSCDHLAEKDEVGGYAFCWL